jgi:hypothetical protein
MPRRFLAPPLVALAAATALALVPAAGAKTRVQTLRFYDKPVSIKVIHADGTVDDRAPDPGMQPGDTLEVNSLLYRGDHRRHARRWTGSSQLRCVFGTGEPVCESHVALAGSMLVFTGNPGVVSNGTGIYQGATGRVISSKEVGDGASDVVARIKLRP